MHKSYMAEQDYINRLAAMEKSIRDDLDEVDAFQMETADGVESEPENRSQRVSVLTNPLELPPVLKTLDPKDIVTLNVLMLDTMRTSKMSR